ncbi:MAG: homoserine dehydrogenase [Alphaproteobacteria bacterium]|nr:homoserine dehydrogenase [Alphaproteobacteria bacterium]
MKIAIAGLGNVGAATLKLLCENAALLRARAGQDLAVTAVSARDKSKPRACDASGIDWAEDPCDLAARADVDTVVEAIGGAEGISYDLALAALRGGKHFVTANKALIAAHGVELALAAEQAGVRLSFEAAVCGAVPVLKALREGLAANHVSSLRGILNGTCNYILTRMEEEGADFDTVLADAQRQGYAEADPSDDIDGFDTANKLAILTAVAFGRAPDLDAVFVEGIRSLTVGDLREAAARGGRIKLLGVATRGADGEVVQRVQPVFVPLDEPLARVGGVLNALEIVSNCAGETLIEGRGAGNPTASAIVADLVDIARGPRFYAFGVPAGTL